MTIKVTIQTAVTPADDLRLPENRDIRKWARAALKGQHDNAQLTVRIVDRAESAALNETYRHKQGPTNVLSFPMAQPGLLDPPLLGDIVVCASLVVDEAAAQGKTAPAHWTHLIVHGVLHLIGYDHADPVMAEEMEAVEISVLKTLGLANPYEETSENPVNRL